MPLFDTIEAGDPLDEEMIPPADANALHPTYGTSILCAVVGSDYTPEFKIQLLRQLIANGATVRAGNIPPLFYSRNEYAVDNLLVQNTQGSINRHQHRQDANSIFAIAVNSIALANYYTRVSKDNSLNHVLARDNYAIYLLKYTNLAKQKQAQLNATPEQQAAINFAWSKLYATQKNYAEAINHLQLTFAYFESIGHTDWQIKCLEFMSRYLFAQKKWADAVVCQQTILEKLDRTVASPKLGTTLSKIGQCHGELCNFTEAKKYFSEAAAIFKKILDHRQWAMNLYSLGLCLLKESINNNDAEHPLQTAINIFQRLSDTYWQAQCENLLGLCLKRQNNFIEAQLHFQQAAELYQVNNHHQRQADNLYQVAECLKEQKNYADAATQFRAAALAYQHACDQEIDGTSEKYKDLKNRRNESKFKARECQYRSCRYNQDTKVYSLPINNDDMEWEATPAPSAQRLRLVYSSQDSA